MKTEQTVILTELVAEDNGYITMDGTTLGRKVMTATPDLYRDATIEEIEAWKNRPTEEMPPEIENQ